MPAFDSDEDGDAARDWDRQRFFRLLVANWPGNADAAPMDVIAAMGDEDRAEALALVERLGDPFEDPETTRARQTVLIDYARIEIELRKLIDDPGPRFSGDGEILHGPGGEPLPDEKIREEARTLLARVERDRAEVLGEAQDGEGD